MLSSNFLRFHAQRCVRTAHSASDPKTIAELEAMASDLARWAGEAEIAGYTEHDQPEP
jgi:hypothetical protein